MQQPRQQPRWARRECVVSRSIDYRIDTRPQEDRKEERRVGCYRVLAFLLSSTRPMHPVHKPALLMQTGIGPTLGITRCHSRVISEIQPNDWPRSMYTFLFCVSTRINSTCFSFALYRTRLFISSLSLDHISRYLLTYIVEYRGNEIVYVRTVEKKKTTTTTRSSVHRSKYKSKARTKKSSISTTTTTTITTNYYYYYYHYYPSRATVLLTH